MRSSSLSEKMSAYNRDTHQASNQNADKMNKGRDQSSDGNLLSPVSQTIYSKIKFLIMCYRIMHYDLPC